MNGTLLGLYRFLFKPVEDGTFTFQNVVIDYGGSVLVLLLCMFIGQWIYRILVDFEKGSRR